MVLLRFLGRLCASGASSDELYSKQLVYQAPHVCEPAAVEQPTCFHDIAVSALHRQLSGLSGTSFQRIDGFLEALLSPEVTGATYVEFYAVPEGDEDEVELSLILLGSARPAAAAAAAAAAAEGGAEGRHAEGHTHLLPDLQQSALFKRMFEEKAPIYAVIDRCPGSFNGALAPEAATTSTASRLAAAASAASAARGQGPRRMRVAAVPLLHGLKLAGALWLEQSAAAAATAGGGGGAAAADGRPARGGDGVPLPLLSDPRALHSLGFACSMCMLGPEGSHAAWLAAALASLGASDCMSALTAKLCGAVTAHVRRRFVLDSSATAALVPPGPEVPLALLLQPSPVAAAAAGGGFGHSQHPPTNPSGAATALEMARSGEGLGERRTGSVGGKLSCRSPAGGRPTSSNVMLFAAHQLGASAGAGVAAQDLGGLSAAASKRRLRALGGGMLTSGLSRDHAALIHARFSLDLSPRHRGAISPADIPRSPSLGPTAPFATASNRSIVIPLPNGGAPATDANGAAHAAAAAAGCNSGTPMLHAKAFPLHRTLLQAHLQQTQQQQQQQHARLRQSLQLGRGAFASAPAAGGLRGAVVAAGPTVQAISASAPSAVVEDTQLLVQNVHKPSGDVCMLMGLTHKTANGMLGGGGGGGTASGYHAPASASATGMTGGGPFAVPGGAAAAAAGAGVPQSLVLLAMGLGEGAALGLYLCFPKRLPGPLLEAVRASCQELMDKALAPVMRAKVKDPAIAPEYETLCCASPGSYAVVRSPSFCGSHLQPPLLPAALSAAYMSTATASDLAAVVAATGAENALPTAATPPELLSGELSTADMEVLLALQAQAAAGQGTGQGTGTGTGMAHSRGQQQPTPQDLSVKRGCSSANRRSGQDRDRALAAASFVRRSIAASGGGAAAARGGAVHHTTSQLSPRSTGASDKRTLTASSLGPLGPGGATGAGGGAAAGAAAGGGGECVEPLNLSQLLQSTPTDILAALGGGNNGNSNGNGNGAAALHTSSFRSLAGLDQAILAAGGGGGGGFTAASIITVSGVDNAPSARQQLDLLVSSIHATINTDPVAAGGGASSSPMDDLDALELGDVLGQGGGGTVFKGRLGTLDVAVKLMELPKMDTAADAAAAAAAARKPAAATPSQASPPNGGGAAGGGGGAAGGGGGAPTEAELAAVDKVCLNARREMLRNATELAVQSRVSHPNIVQIYATYNDVVMVSKRGPPGCQGSTYRLYPAVLNGGGEDGKDRRHVPCVAAAFELCDCGSLGSALAARTFPKAAYRDRERDADGAFSLRPQLVVDMKGVYMTLLDVALALRHLHSLNLVHRDVKPANLLLKSNPRDHRGFTVKLADFGFVLHLSEATEDGSRYAIADQACGTVTHMPPEALLAKAKIDASVDIYAFGILMWEMFSGGVRPFPRLQPDKIPRAVYRGARPTFSDEVPSAYRNLALACWSTDPNRRPRASDVVSLLNALLQELEA